MGKRTRQFLLACIIAAVATSVHSQFHAAADRTGVVLFVDDDAPQGGDGLTWSTAHRFLQDALAFAADPQNGVTEIRLAQGIYKPDQGAPGTQTPGDRNATFQIPSGLALRGGYAGVTADDPDARDWEKFESICSGDLFGNDGPPGSFQNLNDNSLHVATTSGKEIITLEGMTVKAGRGVLGTQTIHGGGLYAMNAALLIEHCRFTLCTATVGGGISLHFSSAIIRHTEFLQNAGLQVGAMEVRSSDVTIQNCHFENNTCGGTPVGGGAVGLLHNSLSDPPSTCSIADSVFLGNRADAPAGGGAIRGGAAILHCHFENNLGDVGGAIFGNASVMESTFVGNLSSDFGGAVYGSGDYTRCQFLNNTSSFDSGAAYAIGGTFIECAFADNIAWSSSGGAVRGWGMFINCTFKGNDAWTIGGGAFDVRSETTFVNCEFSNNVSKDPGGAVRIHSGQHATFINTTIAHNNVLTSTGGVSVSGSATLTNSVIWGNTSGNLSGNADVSYSCIGDGWPGEGNIATDPQFVDVASGNFRLQSKSPCIDAGDNSALPSDAFDLDGDGNTTEPLPIDLDGNRRVVNDPAVANTGWPPGPPNAPMVDIGTYEQAAPEVLGDVNSDGWVNVNDLLIVINSWGPCPNPASCLADIAPSGGDGVVNGADLLLVILHWG